MLFYLYLLGRKVGQPYLGAWIEMNDVDNKKENENA
jgi:hypothetical protein